jgi:hypothetical protein
MIPREEKIQQSVQKFVTDLLFNEWNYDHDEVEVLDSFPEGRFKGALDKNFVAFGYAFDDGGEQGELGSTLVRREHTIEVYVFATTDLWGRNLANAVKRAVETEGVIPLLDFGAGDPPAWLDSLVLLPRGARASHVPVREPRPWEEHIWLTRIRIEDYYDAAES